MQKKYYAVKEGFDFKEDKPVKDLILNTWDECVTYVKGVKGAKYKSFKTLEEARQYLTGCSNISSRDGDYPADCLHIYVDGSFNSETEKYSYAFVAVRDNIIVHVENGASRDNSMKKLRQIAGELEAALRAAAYASGAGERKVLIFHDYAGIYHHASGTWERKDTSSQDYYNKMNEYKNKGLEVNFVKTEGHSGDIFNELTDSFAKQAAGITPTKAVDSYLKEKKLYVKNQGLMDKIKSVVKTSSLMNILIASGQ